MRTLNQESGKAKATESMKRQESRKDKFTRLMVIVSSEELGQ